MNPIKRESSLEQNKELIGEDDDSLEEEFIVQLEITEDTYYKYLRAAETIDTVKKFVDFIKLRECMEDGIREQVQIELKEMASNLGSTIEKDYQIAEYLTLRRIKEAQL